MKIKTELMVLCDHVLVDQSGKLSVIGIFDNMTINTFPGGIPRFFFVTTIKGEAFEKYEFKIKVENKLKREKPLYEFEVKTNPTGKNAKANIIFEMVNIAFKEPSDYQIVLYEKEEKINSIDLQIIDGTASHTHQYSKFN